MTQVQFLFCHKGVQTYLPFPRLIFQANYFCGPNSIASHERIFKSLCPFNPHLPWEHSKSRATSRSCGVLCDLFKSLVLLCLHDYKTCWPGGILRGALPAGAKSLSVDVMPDAIVLPPLCSTKMIWNKRFVGCVINSTQQLFWSNYNQEWPWSLRSSFSLGKPQLLQFNENFSGNLLDNFSP